MTWIAIIAGLLFVFYLIGDAEVKKEEKKSKESGIGIGNLPICYIYIIFSIFAYKGAD